MTSKDVLSEKDMLEKATAIKSFEYSPLGRGLEKETDIAEKQYQRLGRTYKFVK